MASIEAAPRIRHQCSVTKLMEVNNTLAEECKSQLQTTPFGWLLNLHCNIEASGRILEVMATRWNADARAFQVGDRLIPFTLYDIALILGLPVRGEPIDLNQAHSGGSMVEKLLDRHLKTTSPDRNKLVTLLTKTSIQVPNRVRLYIALVFSYFLFPTTSKKVNPSLLPLLDDRANLGTYAWGKAVYDFLVSGLSRAASSMQAKKGRGNLHIQGCTALLQIWACEHLGVGSKNAEINQPFPRFLAWTHQRMYTKKASEAFSKSANVLSVLVAMPWEQDFNVVEEAMETLQETHGSSHPIIVRADGAGPSSIPQTPSNELQLELQAERAEREALARQVRRLKDELDHVKGLVAAVLENSPTIQQNQAATSQNQPPPSPSQNQPQPSPNEPQPSPNQPPPSPSQNQPQPSPNQPQPSPNQPQPSPSPNQPQPSPNQPPHPPHPHKTSPHPHQTSPHPHPHKASPHPYPHTASPHPHKASCPFKPPLWTCQVHRPRLPREAKLPKGKAAKKAKVAVVDVASSPSKQDNAGEAAAAMVDLVSSPSKGATSVTYTRAKTRAHKNLMIVAPHSEPVINEWVDAHFLYQPTAADEAVLADFRKKWGAPKRRGTRKRPNEVDSNEMAISTDTYDLTGREVSSLLADQAQDDGSRWISTAVVDAFRDVLMRKLTQTGHPPPYINFVISVHGGTTILGMAPSTSTQRGKRTRKGKQPIQDDQPQPEAVFRPSWVRSMPTNCNRIFAPAWHNGHFVMMVVDCLQKVFYFFDSLPTAARRALAPTLRKALEQICMENLKHTDVHTWLLQYKDDIPTQDKYASDCGIFMLTFMESLIFSNKIVQFKEADCPRIRERILLELYYTSLLPKAVQS
uniref:Ubiquitin-like protease family profile domain-containing protein n=1 Tax=Fagus sylvatica TaxID=28930 RepID=A0A2N9EZI3_FAGSY